MFIDLKKTFDTIDNEISVTKLPPIWCSRSIYMMKKGHLKNRKHCVPVHVGSNKSLSYEKYPRGFIYLDENK